MSLEIATVICLSLIVLTSVGMCAYVLHRAVKMTHDVKKDYVELLSQTIDNLKAQSLQERVEAKALEKESDVRVEMLKDALQMEQDLLKGKAEEPVFVKTSDGKEIDLRNYEII